MMITMKLMMKMKKMPETGGSIASERCAVDDIDSVEGERSNDDDDHHYYLPNIKYRTYLSHAYDEMCGVGVTWAGRPAGIGVEATKTGNN